MNPADAIAYAVALGIAAAIPGPGITALVARSVGSGIPAGFAMLAGLMCGDLVYLSFVVFGLALVAESFAGVFLAIKVFSIVWLLWLAWQFWFAESHDIRAGAMSSRDLWSAGVSGFAITLGNPKTMGFYLALMPVVIDIREVSVAVWAGILVPLTFGVLLLVGSVYIIGAVGVRKRLAGVTAQRRLHRGAALAMAGAAGSLIIRDL